MFQILSYIAMILSVIGSYYVNRKKVTGMWLWLFSNTIWFSLAIYRKDYAQLIMFLIYFYFSIEGVMKWRK